jgi:hypothetical protein
MGKGYIQINSQHIRAIKGACGSTSNTPCTAAFFNGTLQHDNPCLTISLQITSITPQDINYKITSITGVELPYYLSVDEGVVQLELLADESSQPLPNKTSPCFSIPLTLKSDLLNQTIRTNIFYNNASDVTLSQLPPGHYGGCSMMGTLCAPFTGNCYDYFKY